jgi:hypothetical protein
MTGGEFRTHNNPRKDAKMAEGSDVNYWTLVTILGPIILLAVMIWAFTRNKKSKIDPEVTDRATHEIYKEEQRIHERDGNSGL